MTDPTCCVCDQPVDTETGAYSERAGEWVCEACQDRELAWAAWYFTGKIADPVRYPEPWKIT